MEFLPFTKHHKQMRIREQFLSLVSYIDDSVVPNPQVGTEQCV